MVIIEINKNDEELANNILSNFNSLLINPEIVHVDSLDGSSIIQIIIPIVAIIAPTLSSIVKSIFENSKTSIKYNGIEVSTMGYEKALKLFREVSESNASLSEDINNDNQ